VTGTSAAFDGSANLSFAATVVTSPKLTTGRTIALTGDVTYTSGAFDGSANVTGAATIANKAVTMAKMADLAANSFIGNNGGSAGVPLALTAAQAKTLLAISTADVSGLGTAAQKNTGTSGNTVPLLDGANTWSGKQTFGTADLVFTVAPGASSIGYLGLPQLTKSANYTAVTTDSGSELFFTATATAAIPANSVVAYPIGTVLVFAADASTTLTLQINIDTLRFLPANLTGTRTITGPGFIVCTKKKTGEWWATGVNVT
jgi:hypothetical protein